MVKKGIIAKLLLLLALIINTSTAYAFSDIADPVLEEAAETLKTFGIFSGYSDGRFGVDDTITRAEFAKVIVIATRNQGIAYENSKFSDVGDTYWAKQYISIAKTLGIVGGTSKNTFKPAGSITYEQAAKMIVIGLGYDEEAKEEGGYPEGYVKIADDLGLFEGVSYEPSDAATRGNIALMLRKALDIPYRFAYSDGKSIVREQSELTLFELHEQALYGGDSQGEFPDNYNEEDMDNESQAVG